MYTVSIPIQYICKTIYLYMYLFIKVEELHNCVKVEKKKINEEKIKVQRGRQKNEKNCEVVEASNQLQCYVHIISVMIIIHTVSMLMYT